jgi:DNA helicase-2/ATP-dependent DNA helicase PcrA
MPSRFIQEIPESLVTRRDIRGHDRVADRIPDPMWTKRAASTPAPRPATRSAGDQFSPGDKVRHGAFGEGVVVSSTGVGSDTTVTVAFAGQGVKRLMLSFAPLEKVVEEEPTQQFDPDEEQIEIQDPDLFAP